MTVRLSINVDGDIKQKAQSILNEIGMDMTTAVDIFLRTLIREERIPFELQTEKAYREDTHRQYILSELEKSQAEASNPATKWVTHDEVMDKLWKQREARSLV